MSSFKTRRRKPLASVALRTQPDRRLVDLARSGHAEAFEEVVRRHRAPLVAYAGTIVPPDRAEDVVQAALIRAQQAIVEGDQELDLRPWLFRIVRNGALNDLRDQPFHERLDEGYDGVPQPPVVAERRERIRALVGALMALPPLQREAIVKRELEGRGHDQIAAELGTTAAAVRGLIFRARSSLRRAAGLLIPTPALRFLLANPATEIGTAGPLAESWIGAKAAGLAAIAALALGGGLVADGGAPGSKGVAQGTAQASSGQSDRAGAAGSPAPRSGPSERSGPGGDDRGGGSSGPGGLGSDGHNDDDRSGPGNGDTDGKNDSHGPGKGGSEDKDNEGGSSGPGDGAKGKTEEEHGGEDDDDDDSGGDDPPSADPESVSSDDDSGNSGSGSSGSSGSGSSGSGSSGSGGSTSD